MIKRIQLLALLLACIITVSCNEKQSYLTPISADATILAFGDSLTLGKGATRTTAYPAYLQNLTGHTVINAGISGELSSKGLTRLPGLLEKYSPELIIICHGGNDILRKQNLNQTKNNLLEMIRLAKQKNTQVVLLAVPSPSLRLKPPEFYAEVAEQTNVAFSYDIMRDVLSKAKLKADTFHPNAKGYRQIAERLNQLLSEQGALSI